MKYLFYFASICIILFYSSLNAQWVQTGFNGAGVMSIVAKEGNLFAATWGSYIYKSTDGGVNWEQDTNGLGYWLYTGYVYALAVVPSSDGSGATNLFAGMEEGGIWRSTNDGASWEWVYPLGVMGQHDINMICLGSSGSTVLAGAAQQPGNDGVYRSANDGETWTRCNTGFQTEADSNVRCFSSLKVGSTTYFYAGTDGGAFISTTDGTSWTRISNGLPTGSITSIVATPGPNGSPGINLFAGVGYLGIYHSTDNGSSWSEVNNGIPTVGQSPYVPAIVASPVPNGTTSNIFAIDGTVFLSTNYGANWWDTGWPVSTASDATCLAINGDILFGGSSFTNQIWKYTTAIDSDWIVQQSGTTDTLWSVKAIDNNIVWVSGTGGSVLRSTNGGTTWTSVGGGAIGTDVVFDVEALDANIAFVGTSLIGQSGPTTTKIFKTSNGGGTWTQVFSQPNGLIGGIQMQSQLQGYAMGSPVNGKWTILKTTDGGNTWNHLATEPAQTGGESGLLSFQLLGNTLWFGSSSGYVYRSTDLGGTWASIPTSGIYTLGLHFNSATVGMTGFLSGVTNRSTDGGATWDSASNTGTKEVSSISGIGNEFWAITGSNIAYTNDAGKNWGFTSPGHVGFISLNVVNFSPETSEVNGWAAGATGMILHYQRHNTSVQQDASTLPTKYRLEQNYPNPFNPSTIISYTLPFASNVKLTVYNTLGQSVKVLAEGFKNAGKYSINYNASNLPSGIYFYRLEATGYSATKKLVIIK